MHRLLVDTSMLESEAPALPKDAARHLKVLRPEEGERFELFDGKGAWRVYAHSGGALSAVGALCREERAAHPPLTLFACVTKGSRWDWTIEKATELGADRIVPVISDRTIVRISGDEREAKRASRRIGAYLKAHPQTTAILICHRNDEAPRCFDREMELHG